uniref:Cytidylate kinase n=1 Tax=Thermodesulfobacterium geofontis TaxID=1295609 RepID=A0A7V4N3A3_9BACT
MKKSKIITIDGPASSGKTTVAKMIAQKLNIPLLESGTLYRFATYLLIKSEKSVQTYMEDEKALINFLKETFKKVKIELTPAGTFIYWNGKLIKEELREKEVENLVSQVSANKKVREILTDFMRELGKTGNLITEGRDMGSFVFPYADIKIFLTADEKIRAKRRFKEKMEKGVCKEKNLYEEVFINIKLRDKLDSQREIAPLIIPEGAYIIDTSHLTPEEVLNKILKIIE